MERLTEYDYLAGVKTGDLKAGIDERKAFNYLAAYEDIGTVEELTALAEAHNDGRVVVLPCKAGERVILNNWTYLVEGFLSDNVGQWQVRLAATVPNCERYQRGHCYMSFEEFEKMTRAEAEAALKGRTDG
ncbi:MAG: hypothetical protein RR365_14190 [Bacteroides sp.]